MELHQLHHTMQDGNDTNVPSYYNPTYPWSTYAGGTTTETPGFCPMLIPVDATSETDDDVDPNDFVNGIGFPTNAPKEPITGTTSTNPLTERTRYIAFLISKTNRLFTDRYQLDSHWDQLLSLFGQAPLTTPRVTQLWKYLQRQQKR